MQPSKEFCKRQINRLEGLPFYSSIGVNGYAELVYSLQTTAQSEDIAKAAVDALLADTCRAESATTNRVPSAGELRVWIESATPKRAEQYCGGCNIGWIHTTIFYKGLPYYYAGRCICVGGTCRPEMVPA